MNLDELIAREKELLSRGVPIVGMKLSTIVEEKSNAGYVFYTGEDQGADMTLGGDPYELHLTRESLESCILNDMGWEKSLQAFESYYRVRIGDLVGKWFLMMGGIPGEKGTLHIR